MTAREAAYINKLVLAPRSSSYSPSAHRNWWRARIAQTEYSLSPYASEVADPRIKTHLEAILPRRYRNDGGNHDGSQTWQQAQAVKVYESLCNDDNVLEVHTDASYWEDKQRPRQSHSGGGIVVKTRSEQIREPCYMGSMMENPSEAEIGALYRGLQIVRNTLERESASNKGSPYRRVVFATDSINCIEALSGYVIPVGKMTIIAALCRIEAYEIAKANEGIESINFVWLPRGEKGIADADLLSRSARLSVYNFVDDDRGRI